MRFLGKRLPPLGTMVAFEAAARYQSFTLAAAELNLTQAAISRICRRTRWLRWRTTIGTG